MPHLSTTNRSKMAECIQVSTFLCDFRNYVRRISRTCSSFAYYKGTQAEVT